MEREPHEEEYDLDLLRVFRELGSPDALFEMSRGWVRAKLFVSFALMIYGVIANYLWFVHGPGRFGFVWVELLVLPPVFGGGLLVFMYYNRGLRVLVYPTGVLRLRSGEIESYPWDSLEGVRIKAVAVDEIQFRRDEAGRPLECWFHIKMPAIQIWKTWIQLEMKDESTVRFLPALASYNDLVELLLRRSFTALWPEILQTIGEGKDVRFGDLTANLVGLRSGTQHCAWSEISELSLSQRTLSIKRKKSWLPWYIKDLSSVTNPHLLAALLDYMKSKPTPPPAINLS